MKAREFLNEFPQIQQYNFYCMYIPFRIYIYYLSEEFFSFFSEVPVSEKHNMNNEHHLHSVILQFSEMWECSLNYYKKNSAFASPILNRTKIENL